MRRRCYLGFAATCDSWKRIALLERGEAFATQRTGLTSRERRRASAAGERLGSTMCPHRKPAKDDPTLQPLRIALRRAIAWPEKKPEDQAQQWQQHNNKYPNQFLLVRSRALEDI
jgi:hypothetical protein